jgi:hypothetical protein
MTYLIAALAVLALILLWKISSSIERATQELKSSTAETRALAITVVKAQGEITDQLATIGSRMASMEDSQQLAAKSLDSFEQLSRSTSDYLTQFQFGERDQGLRSDLVLIHESLESLKDSLGPMARHFDSLETDNFRSWLISKMDPDGRVG